LQSVTSRFCPAPNSSSCCRYSDFNPTAGSFSATLDSGTCSLDATFYPVGSGFGSSLESRFGFVDHALVSLRYANQAVAAEKSGQ
jgi:hypothetical protein